MKANPIDQALSFQRALAALKNERAPAVDEGVVRNIKSIAEGVPALKDYADIFLKRTGEKHGFVAKLLGRDQYGKQVDSYSKAFHSDLVLLGLLENSDPKRSESISLDTLKAKWTPETNLTERLTTLLLLPKADRPAALKSLVADLTKMEDVDLLKFWLKAPYQSVSTRLDGGKLVEFQQITLGAASNPRFPIALLRDLLLLGSQHAGISDDHFKELARSIAANFSNQIAANGSLRPSGDRQNGPVESTEVDLTYIALRNALNDDGARATFDEELLKRGTIKQSDVPQAPVATSQLFE